METKLKILVQQGSLLILYSSNGVTQESKTWRSYKGKQSIQV